MLNILKSFFVKDLNKLKSEIELYKKEGNLWLVDQAITNSAGNLCLHLVGNLNTFIGGQLGKTGYIRKRDLEFSLKNVSKKELLFKISETITIIENTFDKLSEAQLLEEYPILVLKKKTTIVEFLIHLSTHLSYHLGQINYHRRLLDN